jgi:hypothetical protein
MFSLSVSAVLHSDEDSLHHDLETVEALGLGGLDLGRESLDKVLVDNTIRLILARSI